MPDTTGGLFGPSKEDEKLARDLAVLRAQTDKQMELAEQKYQQQLPTKKLGRPGYVNTEPKSTAQPLSRETQAFGRAAVASAQLGGPTSYGGQQAMSPDQAAKSRELYGAGRQDFYQPIPVTRGMTTTYQGPRYGEEFLTPGQASQAFRREQKAKYAPAETDSKAIGVQAVVDAKTMERNIDWYRKGLASKRPDLFTMVNNELIPKSEYAHIIMAHERTAAEKNADNAINAALKDLAPHEQKLKDKEVLTEENIADAMGKFKETVGRDLSKEEIAGMEASGRWGEWVKRWKNIKPRPQAQHALSLPEAEAFATPPALKSPPAAPPAPPAPPAPFKWPSFLSASEEDLRSRGVEPSKLKSPLTASEEEMERRKRIRQNPRFYESFVTR